MSIYQKSRYSKRNRNYQKGLPIFEHFESLSLCYYTITIFWFVKIVDLLRFSRWHIHWENENLHYCKYTDSRMNWWNDQILSGIITQIDIEEVSQRTYSSLSLCKPTQYQKILECRINHLKIAKHKYCSWVHFYLAELETFF